MIGLNYLDKFIPIIKNKLNISLHNKELNYKGEIKYSRKETPYKLKDGAYKYYIEEVKGNEGLTRRQVKAKISSDILSGQKMDSTIEGVEVYRYGCLTIKVENRKIIYLYNNRGSKSSKKFKFNVDTEYRDYLRELWNV